MKGLGFRLLGLGDFRAQFLGGPSLIGMHLKLSLAWKFIEQTEFSVSFKMEVNQCAKVRLEGQGDLVSRLFMGITRVTVWLRGFFRYTY